MPNSNRYNILLISIFCQNSLIDIDISKKVYIDILPHSWQTVIEFPLEEDEDEQREEGEGEYLEREKGKDGAGEQKMRIRFREDEEYEEEGDV